METPVVYFYAPSEMSVDVRVGFPRDPATVGTIEWKDVRIKPATAPSFPTGDSPSHYYAARATEAAPIMVNGQAEKFLFYRGVASFDVPVMAKALDDGGVHISNLWADELTGVVLFENRGGKIGYRIHGRLGTSGVALDAPRLDGSLAALRSEIERMLVENGLFPKEAAAMVATWNDSWFEEGTRVFYVLPQRSLETVLPLTVDPAPAAINVARVFVGRMEVLTAASERAVERAVTRNDMTALRPYARFFGPIAERILARTADVAVRQRYSQVADMLLTSYVRDATSCP
jgi:hypothetical protein